MAPLSVVQTLQQHRSVRRFTDQAVDAAMLQQIVTAAQQSASSMYMQQYSVIQITNPTTQQRIAKISQGTFIGQAPVLLIMVADQYRNLQIATEQHQDPELLHSADKFMAAVFDATLVTAGIVNAAESLGLGTTILGSIQNDGATIIDMLQLPTLTLPVLGIVLGYPAEKPEQKPRLPLNQVLYQDTYPTAAQVTQELGPYDDIVQHYYANRQSNARSESFEQMVTENLTKHPAKRDQLLKVIHQQGFSLK